jgi:hypothetical protein
MFRFSLGRTKAGSRIDRWRGEISPGPPNSRTLREREHSTLETEAMKRRRFLEAVTAALLAVLIAAVLATPAMAQGNSGNNKNKDKDGDGGTEEPVEPNLPPIEYHIQLFDFPSDETPIIHGSNNVGQVVGFNNGTNGFRAWLYDATVDPDTAIDLNVMPITGVPEGYVIGAALDINDFGFAVGFLQLDGDTTDESRRGYVLDTNTWIMQTFPNSEEPAYSFTFKINEDGLVLGGYDWFNEDGWRIHEGFYLYDLVNQSFTFPDLEGEHIFNRSMDLNNSLGGRPAQVAGQEQGNSSAPKKMLRLTLPDFLEVIDLHEDSTRTTFGALNDAGTMCGHISFDISTHPRKREIVTYPFRHGESLELLPIPPSGGSLTFDINSAGDIVTSYYVYHDDWEYVSPDDVVIGGAETMERWFAGRFEIAMLGDRNASDFGLLVGTLYESDGKVGFVLVPAPAAD